MGILKSRHKTWVQAFGSPEQRKNKGIKLFGHAEDFSHIKGKNARLCTDFMICSLTSRYTKPSCSPAVCCKTHCSSTALILCRVAGWPNCSNKREGLRRSNKDVYEWWSMRSSCRVQKNHLFLIKLEQFEQKQWDWSPTQWVLQAQWMLTQVTFLINSFITQKAHLHICASTD